MSSFPLRSPANIYLTTGTRLISTRGNMLLTIVDDTCGRHDTLGGACAMESNMVRYAIEKRFMHAPAVRASSKRRSSGTADSANATSLTTSTSS